MYGLFVQHHKVATLPKLFLTVSGSIIRSLKQIGQLKHGNGAIILS